MTQIFTLQHTTRIGLFTQSIDSLDQLDTILHCDPGESLRCTLPNLQRADRLSPRPSRVPDPPGPGGIRARGANR